MKYVAPKQAGGKYFRSQPKPFMAAKSVSTSKRLPRKPLDSMAFGSKTQSQPEIYGKAMKRAFKNTKVFGVGEK